MAKNQKQQLYDDLNVLLDKYPNMRAGDFMITTQSFLGGMWRSLPKATTGQKRKVCKLYERYKIYRLG
jgi:hypothetical protein